MSRLAVLVVAATLILLFAGAMVPSTGSGDATKDWPFHEGRIVLPLEGTLFYEMMHRYIGMAVGVLTVILAVALLLKESRRSVRWLAIAAVILVAGNGLLGWQRVDYGYSPGLSILHTAVAQIFLAVTVTIAVLVSRTWKEGPPARLEDPAIPKQAALMTAAIYMQILFGALYRHTEKSIALHLIWAAFVFFLVGWVSGRVAKRTRDLPWIRKPAIGLMILLTLQLVLGFASLGIVSMESAKTIETPVLLAVILSLHLLAGAGMFGLGVAMTLRARRCVNSPQPEGVTS